MSRNNQKISLLVGNFHAINLTHNVGEFVSVISGRRMSKAEHERFMRDYSHIKTKTLDDYKPKKNNPPKILYVLKDVWHKHFFYKIYMWVRRLFK